MTAREPFGEDGHDLGHRPAQVGDGGARFIDVRENRRGGARPGRRRQSFGRHVGEHADTEPHDSAQQCMVAIHHAFVFPMSRSHHNRPLAAWVDRAPRWSVAAGRSDEDWAMSCTIAFQDALGPERWLWAPRSRWEQNDADSGVGQKLSVVSQTRSRCPDMWPSIDTG
jgi:hypothetical protein